MTRHCPNLLGAILVAIILHGVTANAQAPGIEMYGGVAYRRAFSDGGSHGFGGLHGSIAFNKTDYFGLMIAAGGQYRPVGGDLIHGYDLMAGPQFVKRGKRVDASAHVLFGLVHGLARGAHEDFPGAGLGAALDLHGKGLVGMRFQADYLPNYGAVLYNDVRITIGGVLRLRRN